MGTVVLALVGVLLGTVVLGQRVVDAVLARLDEADIRGHLVVVVAAAVGGSALTYAVGIDRHSARS